MVVLIGGRQPCYKPAGHSCQESPPTSTQASNGAGLAPSLRPMPHACLADLALAFSHVHVDELRPLDRQEADGALGGHRLGQQRLTRACTTRQG